MTSICLVRHGETDWNALGKLQGRTDIPLNNVGIVQAKECQSVLKKTNWDVLITSPLMRAKETAEIINRELELPLIEMDEFVERHYGDVEGMTVTERMTAFPNRNYPNQEDSSSLKNRVLSGIEKINFLYSGKRILIVTHGGVIRTILIQFSNGVVDPGKIELINASISNIEYTKQEWKIKDYNQISHLTQYSNPGRV